MDSSAIEGELVMASIDGWLKRADELARHSNLDLGKVTRMDSAGASFLLELTRRARRNGHELEFSNIPGRASSLIKFLQIDAVLKLTS